MGKSFKLKICLKIHSVTRSPSFAHFAPSLHSNTASNLSPQSFLPKYAVFARIWWFSKLDDFPDRGVWQEVFIIWTAKVREPGGGSGVWGFTCTRLGPQPRTLNHSRRPARETGPWRRTIPLSNGLGLHGMAGMAGAMRAPPAPLPPSSPLLQPKGLTPELRGPGRGCSRAAWLFVGLKVS